MKKILSVLTLLVLLLSACSKKEFQTYEFEYFYFDTPISIKLYDYDEIDMSIEDDIEKMLVDIELTFSPTNEESLAYILNENGEVEANEYMLELTQKSIDSCEMSNDVIDITSGNLIDIWSINNDNNIPSEQQINDALQTIDCNNIEIDGSTVRLLNNAQVDYGSVTKGYAADKIEEMLLENDYNSGIINLGGNVQLINKKPDDSEFVVAIMAPEVENVLNENALQITTNNNAVVTSGINQRYFIGDDGTVYHHLLDLSTGYPANNELGSVTIITKEGYVADSYSTYIFMLGLDKGYEEVLKNDEIDAIFITKDRKIYSTSDEYKIEVLKDNYELVQYE